MAIIDFHCHVLPEIDDGSKSVEMTGEILDAAARQGIQVIAATPHFYADQMRIESFLHHRREAFAKAEPLAAERGILLICGAEVAFFSGMGRADGLELLKFENTNAMMVEMPFRQWTDQDLREISLLAERGIRPVIAHLERFYPFQKNKRPISTLLEMPVFVQINAEALIERRTRKIALHLFREGSAHLLGSDCHNTTSRAENLASGREILKKKLGQEVLDHIDYTGMGLLHLVETPAAE